MDGAGKRYRNLANRCRQSATASPSDKHRAALMRMARGYDRRANELEFDG